MRKWTIYRCPECNELTVEPWVVRGEAVCDGDGCVDLRPRPRMLSVVVVPEGDLDEAVSLLREAQECCGTATGAKIDAFLGGGS